MTWPLANTVNARPMDHMKSNYIKAEIDYTQQNNKWGVYGDKPETITLVIRKCSNLAQMEY